MGKQRVGILPCKMITKISRDLPWDAAFALVYLWTCPHRKVGGLFRLPLGYMAGDLDVSIEEAREKIDLLQKKGYVAYEEGVIFIRGYMQVQNKLQGKVAADTVKGMLSDLEEVDPPSELLALWEDEAKAIPALWEALTERGYEPLEEIGEEARSEYMPGKYQAHGEEASSTRPASTEGVSTAYQPRREYLPSTYSLPTQYVPGGIGNGIGSGSGSGTGNINTTSAYAEASADRSDGLTSRAEKLTGTSQDTAVRAEAEISKTLLTEPTERTEGRDAVEPKDSLCPNQPKVLETTAGATGGPAGSVGPTVSNADADDDDVAYAADAEAGEKPASVPPCPHKDIVAIYHEVLPELRAVKVWNSTREKRLRARWREDKARQTLDWWRKYFESVRASDFLMGRKADWSGDFDWLICPTNMAKVLEGRYHDDPAGRGLPEEMTRKLDALFRDLASAWPADRIGDAKEAKRLFFAVFSPDVLADKERANMRLSNIEAWARVVLSSEAQYVPRLDRWMSGLDPDIAPADNGEREEVA